MDLFRLSAFRNAYAIRGALIWVGVRIAWGFTRSAGGFAGGAGSDVLASLFILLVVGAAVVLDARRRGEDVFLANLGIAPVAIFLHALPLALLLEILAP